MLRPAWSKVELSGRAKHWASSAKIVRKYADARATEYVVC